MTTFRPKARLVEILGEHLIRDNTVGLLELVKNSYDADATEVQITLENIDDIEETTVTVKDNGDGMAMETIVGPWLEPATASKDILKREQRKSNRGRLPLGEKGIGRFATHKLGKQLLLVTRHFGSSKEVVLQVDWRRFEAQDAYLHEISLDPKERVPKVFLGETHGTLLQMKGARELWKENDLRHLQASLQKLKSPTRGATDFNIRLSCADRPQYENLDTVNLLDTAHFAMTGLIDADGMLEFDFSTQLPGTGKTKQSEKRQIWKDVFPKVERNPSCGPLIIDLRVWLRKSELLKAAGITKEQLNVFSGVSLFRDGMRVLPYGEEGNDWLLLDKRRIDDPGNRFANNQIIGSVEIDQTQNPRLVDKANREGLQENQQYDDLCELVKATIRLMETISSNERSKVTGKSREEEQKDDISDTIKVVEDGARRSEKDAEALKYTVTKLQNEGWISPEGASVIDREVTELKSQLANFREKAEIANFSVKELFADDEKEREIFLHLVSVGMIAERISHEFDRIEKQMETLFSAVKSIPQLNENVLRTLDAAECALNVLQSELLPLAGTTHRKSSKKGESVDVREVISSILVTNSSRIKDTGMAVPIRSSSKESFYTRMNRSSLAQVLDNLIDNAIYWVSQKSAVDEREMLIWIEPEKNNILISNNGSPIPPYMRDHLFQKFQTSKPNGRGLGLFICKELLRLHGGDIASISAETNEHCLSGASFLITLPRAITSEPNG